MNTTYQLHNPIPRRTEDFSRQDIEQIVNDHILHETTRLHIKALFSDYVHNVDFMKLVREYASMEMDQRMFRSFKYWGIVVLSGVITSLIGFLVGMFS